MSDKKHKSSKNFKGSDESYPITPLNFSITSSKTSFQVFFERVSQLFTRNTTPSSKLSGRINEWQARVDSVLRDLITFKASFEIKKEPPLFNLSCSHIDPLIRELARLLTLDYKESATQQVKQFSRYNRLIEKAEEWISLKKETEDHNKIIAVVFKQTAHNFNERIDRDIKLIDDYITCGVENIPLMEDLKEELKKQLLPTVSPYIVKLIDLKQKQQEMTLDSLVTWQTEADLVREKLFSGALHIIDQFLKDFMPSQKNEHPISLALLMKLKNLEERVSVISDLAKQTPIDKKQTRTAINMLASLEKEAHELNQNLMLSHENSLRLQELLETLSKLQNHFALT